MSVALLDTTVLSNFAHVRRPELITAALGRDVATTPLILTELWAGETSGFLPLSNWRWLSIVQPTVDEQQLAKELNRQLDAGESECLAVALTRTHIFLSDDLAARRVAELGGLVVSGTLGVLIKLVETGRLSLLTADELLVLMIAHGYRSPVSSLQDIDEI